MSSRQQQQQQQQDQQMEDISSSMGSVSLKYDPSKSSLKAETLAEFVCDEWTQDLESFPGIGPKTVEILNEENVHTTPQLVAVYLQLFDGERSLEAINEAFFDYLHEKKIGRGVSKTNLIYALNEKLSIIFPLWFGKTLETVKEEDERK